MMLLYRAKVWGQQKFLRKLILLFSKNALNDHHNIHL